MLCKHCNKEKQIFEFVKDKNLKSGRKSICKSCKNIKAKNRRIKNPNVEELIRKYKNFE